ncbi:hypothetical protein R1sor_012620 [Riccia sorocarpa]|uniref:Uncharacterized protein n=1 Tax=Riccia sorocarpa TaxID=122646 RepID=A0ABD3I670_9MARC
MGNKSEVTPMDWVQRSLEAARERVLGDNASQNALSFSPFGSTSSTARESKEANLPAQINTISQSSRQRQFLEMEGEKDTEANRELPLDLEKEDFPPLVVGALFAPRTIQSESLDSQSSKPVNSGGESRDNRKTPVPNAGTLRPRVGLQRNRTVRNPYLDGVDSFWGKSVSDEETEDHVTDSQEDLIRTDEGTTITVPQNEDKDKELLEEEPGIQDGTCSCSDVTK